MNDQSFEALGGCELFRVRSGRDGYVQAERLNPTDPFRIQGASNPRSDTFARAGHPAVRSDHPCRASSKLIGRSQGGAVSSTAQQSKSGSCLRVKLLQIVPPVVRMRWSETDSLAPKSHQLRSRQLSAHSDGEAVTPQNSRPRERPTARCNRIPLRRGQLAERGLSPAARR